jgi:nucleoside-diphosphate-sugar epimerase
MSDTTLSLPCQPEQADKFLSEPSQATIHALGRVEGPILVLGAGGKMGLHLTSMIHRADAAAGHKQRVTAVSRFGSVNGTEPFKAQGIPTIACDLEDDNAVAALPDAPNIVFMAGAKFGTGDQPDLLERMNVRLPQRIASRFPGARCLVFSTGCVYSMVPVTSSGSLETDPTDPPGAYAQSCLQREQAFAEAARNHGSKVALIRLNYATEFRYGVLVDIASKVYAGEPVDLTMPQLNLIWQRDAVDQILQAFPLANTNPLVLNVTGSESLEVRELAERFARIFDKPVHFSGQPAHTAWLSNASLSHKSFGLPGTSLAKMIEWTAAWIAQGNPTFNKPTGFQIRDGKF